MDAVTPTGNYRTAPYTFRTIEQCYQYARAYLYGFEEDARQILNAPTPQVAKAIGNRVRSQLSAPLQLSWQQPGELIMEALAYHKFRNPEPRAQLQQTGYATLVEASPDPYWGPVKPSAN